MSDPDALPHRTAEYDRGYMWFFCPGCDTHHRIRLGAWEYNGDPIRPTFRPSIMVTYSGAYGVDGVCHSFVTDGQIMYLVDSFHKLRGHTIELPLLDDEASPKTVA